MITFGFYLKLLRDIAKVRQNSFLLAGFGLRWPQVLSLFFGVDANGVLNSY